MWTKGGKREYGEPNPIRYGLGLCKEANMTKTNAVALMLAAMTVPLAGCDQPAEEPAQTAAPMEEPIVTEPPMDTMGTETPATGAMGEPMTPGAMGETPAPGAMGETPAPGAMGTSTPGTTDAPAGEPM